MKLSNVCWGAAVLLCVGCATSPTGRKQLILVPSDQMSAMGTTSFSDLKKKEPLSYDSRATAYVECVARLLVDIADEASSHEWEIRLFRSKEVNAFALPGKKIGVYEGLLGVANTQAQLAAVLGHEVGHVQAQHGNERVSESLAIAGGLSALDATLSSVKGREGIMAALGIGTSLGVALPHSRTQESEADRMGLELMSRAGFDPKESVELWKNMAKAGGGGPPEFLSTHPSHGTRIKDLAAQIPAVQPIYEKAKAEGKIPQCMR